MACGFRATRIADVLGDGSRYGVRLRYLGGDPEPRGTAGALKFRRGPPFRSVFLMLNGDVLSTSTSARRFTQARDNRCARHRWRQWPSNDPSAYGPGPVRTRIRAVTGFLEKPGARAGSTASSTT